MTTWKTVQGSQETRPAEFDTTSSPTTVYQRRNVHRVTVDYENTAVELWEYEERTMTHAEYETLMIEQNRVDIIAIEDAQADADALSVDHEIRLAMLEHGLT